MDKLTPIEIATLSDKYMESDIEFATYLSAFGVVRKVDEELNMDGILIKDILKDVIVCAKAAIDMYNELVGE